MYARIDEVWVFNFLTKGAVIATVVLKWGYRLIALWGRGPTYGSFPIKDTIIQFDFDYQ
jgi:hypothetical protein